MSEPTAEFTEVHVPARIAELAFTVQMPTDWRRIDLPEEQLNFDKPDYFLPLFVCMAPYGVVVFSVAARPAYGDGTLRQWVEFIAREQGVQIEHLRPVEVRGAPAMMADAVQQSEAGMMHLRTIFMEDGGRLINISTMAPAQIWNSVESQFDNMLAMFKLDAPRGPTVALEAEAAASDAVCATTESSPSGDDIVETALQGIVTEDPRLTANDANAADVSHAPDEAPSLSSLPEWWQKAVALQETGEMEAAEKTVLDSVQHLGALASVADLWKRRMLQLMLCGDRAGAKAAFQRASDWIFQYASSATSGGEGAALSLQRKEFMLELEQAYGTSP